MACADSGASPHPAVGAYFSLEDDEDNMQKRLVRSRQRSRAPSVATGPATLLARSRPLHSHDDGRCIKALMFQVSGSLSGAPCQTTADSQ